MPDTDIIEARMPSPVVVVPAAGQALNALAQSAGADALPETTVYLVHLRASQINGCSRCVEIHSRELRQAGESDERIWAVAAWREARTFTAAERAALALTEAMTRLSDRSDPVSDEVWAQAAEHYDRAGLAALIIQIGVINVWNRFNVATRQPSGRRR